MEIEIMYSCNQCGLDKIKLKVPTRTNEDVITWLNNIVMVKVGKDHRQRKPGCKATHLTGLYIPFEGRDKIGGPVVQ